MPDKLIEVPGRGVIAFPDSMSNYEIEVAIRNQRPALERAAEPFVEAGTGITHALGGVFEVPSALKDLLAVDRGRNPRGRVTGARILKEALSGIYEGTKETIKAERASAAPLREFRTDIAHVPLIGAPIAHMIRSVGEGNYAGALGEGVLNFGPMAAGKLAKGLKAGSRAAEEVEALTRASQSPTGRMVEELGGNRVAPEVTAQRAAKIANEELRGMNLPPVKEGAASGSEVIKSLKERLAERADEYALADERAAAQAAAERGRLLDELQRPFPERFTPTEAQSFAAPTLKDRLADLRETFPKGSKGNASQVRPFDKGAPGRTVRAQELKTLAKNTRVEDAQQWQMIVKGLKDDADALRAVKSDFFYNRMGGARDAETLVANLKKAPQDTVYAILGEDAGPTYQVLKRLDELKTRNQNMSPRGGKPGMTMRMEVLEEALNRVGQTRAGQGTLGKVLTAGGIPTHSRVARALSLIAVEAPPQSVLRFWRAFDVFTRNGYAPAFIQTVNGIEKRTRKEERNADQNQ